MFLDSMEVSSVWPFGNAAFAAMKKKASANLKNAQNAAVLVLLRKGGLELF